jgi:hypothetical protein
LLAAFGATLEAARANSTDPDAIRVRDEVLSRVPVLAAWRELVGSSA